MSGYGGQDNYNNQGGYGGNQSYDQQGGYGGQNQGFEGQQGGGHHHHHHQNQQSGGGQGYDQGGSFGGDGQRGFQDQQGYNQGGGQGYGGQDSGYGGNQGGSQQGGGQGGGQGGYPGYQGSHDNYASAPAAVNYNHHSQDSWQQQQNAPAGYPQGGGSGDFNNVGQNQGGGGYSGGYGGPGQPPANVNVTGHDERGNPIYSVDLPPGAQPAPEGMEGYIPQGMSRDEAKSRGFLGEAGGGLLGAWLGHKLGKKQGHGMLGLLAGAGGGAILGDKLF